MKTLWRKNQENSSDGISHAWAPLNKTIPMTKVWHHAGDALDDPSSHEKYVT
jgi:hypothetical protein